METAEIVLPGHPDKMADIISDRVLDYLLNNVDINSRAAVEVLIASGVIPTVIIAGETTAKVPMNKLREIVRQTLGVEEAVVIDLLNSQSPEIAARVVRDKVYSGDQGIAVGYATSETPELMPIEYMIARRMANDMYFDGIQYQTRDGKVLVTVDGLTLNFVISCCHLPGAEAATEKLIYDFIGRRLDEYNLGWTNIGDIIINPPDGSWTLGGFKADTGLTGRKIVADAYGARVPHGGGCLSGKDLSKPDRLYALVARFIARQIVTEGIAEQATVKLTYAMGHEYPEDVSVDISAIGQHYRALDVARKLANMYTFDEYRQAFMTRYGEWFFSDLTKFGHFGNPAVSQWCIWEK